MNLDSEWANIRKEIVSTTKEKGNIIDALIFWEIVLSGVCKDFLYMFYETGNKDYLELAIKNMLLSNRVSSLAGFIKKKDVLNNNTCSTEQNNIKEGLCCM